MIEHSDGTFQDRYKKYFQDLQDRTESYKMLNYSLQQKAKNAFGDIFCHRKYPRLSLQAQKRRQIIPAVHNFEQRRLLASLRTRGGFRISF